MHPRHSLRGPQQSQEHHDAALVLAWMTLTYAAEGALATEESAHPSLGQVHPEVQTASASPRHYWQRHDLPEVPHPKLRIEFCGFRHQVPLDDPADKPTSLPNRSSLRLQHYQPTTKKAIRVRPYLALIRGFQNDACTNLRSTPSWLQ